MWKSKHYSSVEKISIKFGALLGDGFKKAGLDFTPNTSDGSK